MIRRLPLGLLAAIGLLAAACAPSPPAQPTVAPTAAAPAGKPAPTTAPAAAPTAAPAAKPTAAAAAPQPTTGAAAAAAPKMAPASEQHEFKIGFGSSIGFSHLGLVTAIEELNKQGYKIEPVFFNQGDLATQATTKGEVGISSGSNADVFNGIQKGAKLKLISDRNANEWTIYSTAAIKSCQELDGKRLAVHSTAAVSTAMVHYYLKTNCPQAKPNELIIAGSDNRAAALQAGQIDATPLELADGIALDRSGGGKFHRMADFSSSLPLLSTTATYANAEFLSKNPGVVRDVLRAQLQAHRKFRDNPGFLGEQALRLIPNFDKDDLDDVIKGYTAIKGFDVDGGLTDERIDYSLKFFVDADSIKPGLSVSDVSDLAPLNDVLKELGKQ
jgi:NitT/TauT family transport system substrate-binding protein